MSTPIMSRHQSQLNAQLNSHLAQMQQLAGFSNATQYNPGWAQSEEKQADPRRELQREYEQRIEGSLKHGIATAYAVTLLVTAILAAVSAAVVGFGIVKVAAFLGGALTPALIGYGWHLWVRRKAKIELATKLMMLP